MKRCKIFTALSAVCLLSLVSFAQRADATFSVEDDAADFPTYGHARNPVFEETVSGESELTEKDKIFLENVNRQNPKFEGYYVKLLLGLSDTRLNSVKKATSDPMYMDFVLPSENLKIGADSVSLAFGMKSGNLGGEFELTTSETIRDTIQIDSNLKGNISMRQFAAIANLLYFYTLPQFSTFHLYGFAGIGVSRLSPNIETVDTTDQASDVYNDTSTHIAGQLGVGLKYQLLQWLILDANLRASHRGAAIFGPVEADLIMTEPNGEGFKIKASHVLNTGVYLGVAVPLG